MIKRDPFAFMLVVVLAFMCVMLLSGCVGTHTLEELEDEALRTGDWSLVEAREARRYVKSLRQEFVDYCLSLKGSYFLLCEIRAGSLRTPEDFSRACMCATAYSLHY